jgi:hypothetical protein
MPSLRRAAAYYQRENVSLQLGCRSKNTIVFFLLVFVSGAGFRISICGVLFSLAEFFSKILVIVASLLLRSENF